MSPAPQATSTPWTCRAALLLCVAALSGCGALRPSSVAPPVFYALEAPATPTLAQVQVQTQAQVQAQSQAPRRLPTLMLTPPRAASGFDSQRIIYVRTDHQREYFARSEWVDTPARMLGPLMASALERSGAFAAVVLAPASGMGEQRLDTEVVRLQQNFQTVPSRVQFTLRAQLVDSTSRRVLASREFSDEVAAPSDTPQGGVQAANEVVQRVLAQLAQFAATPVQDAP